MRPHAGRRDGYRATPVDGSTVYLRPVAGVPVQGPLTGEDDGDQLPSMRVIVITAYRTRSYLGNMHVSNRADQGKVLLENREAEPAVVGRVVKLDDLHLVNHSCCLHEGSCRPSSSR